LELAAELAADKVDGDGTAKLSRNAKKKQKKKAKKAAAADQDDVEEVEEIAEEEPPTASDSDKQQMMQALLGMNLSGRGSGDKKDESHKFWDTQPVPKLSSESVEAGGGSIDPEKTVEDIRQEPYGMPKGFEWSTIDVSDPDQVGEVYTLLTENYVEDDDNMFRFDYSKEFLKWALLVPGYFKEWHVGVRATKTKKLMACITGVPAHIHAYDNDMKMAEINFLCVHKKLRTKRLAPVLIKEVTRRINLTGIFQAVYTAGVVLPKPIASCRYYHRSINPKKLIEVGFSRLAPRMTMARTIKLYKLPAEPQVPGIRPMVPGDVASACKLVVNYLKNFKLYNGFNEEEFGWVFLPRDGVVYSYVVADPTTGEITDFTSFYSLPSSIIGHEKHSTLNAAYSFYNVATTCKLEELMNDTLTLARQRDFDVFNALDIMENGKFLKDLKFGVGDGHLQYYLYNWLCPQMASKDVALVLL
jgi:glycylpeptide N-tetradecanoyltransferase